MELNTFVEKIVWCGAFSSGDRDSMVDVVPSHPMFLGSQRVNRKKITLVATVFTIKQLSSSAIKFIFNSNHMSGSTEIIT